jgi:hypothetical protein
MGKAPKWDTRLNAYSIFLGVLLIPFFGLSAQVRVGSQLTVSPGTALTIEGNLTVDEDAALIVHSDPTASGSLIVKGTPTISGAVTYHRYLTGKSGILEPWHLVSSPVASQVVGTFLQNNAIATNTSNTIYGLATFNEAFSATTDAWAHYAVGSTYNEHFTAGQGYEILTSEDGSVIFSGSLSSNPSFSVVRSESGTHTGWNLLGNPYPSYLNIANGADPIATANFLEVNTDQLDPSFQAIYCWDPDEETYFPVNLVTTQKGVAPGQGFLVRAKTDPGSVSFPLTLRTHTTDVPFKSSQAWPALNLAASVTGTKVSTEVLFIPDMTPGLDPGFDAGRFDMGEPFALATRLVEGNSVDFHLQCLPDTDFENLVIPVSLRAPRGQEVTFSLTADGLPHGIKVYLEDRATGRFTRLDEPGSTLKIALTENYDGPGRFFLRTASVDINPDAGYPDLFTIIPMPEQGRIRITGPLALPARATLVDVTGRAVASSNLSEPFENEILVNPARDGLYLLIIESAQPTFVKKLPWIAR